MADIECPLGPAQARGLRLQLDEARCVRLHTKLENGQRIWRIEGVSDGSAQHIVLSDEAFSGVILMREQILSPIEPVVEEWVHVDNPAARKAKP